MSTTPRMALIGHVAGVLVSAFLAFDTVIKLLDLQPVRESLAGLGYAPTLGRTIGIVELVCLVLYVMPRTAVLGAILLTALLGGGIASHVRLGSPLFTHILFGVYLGLFVWGALFLRNERLRQLIPVLR